MCRRESKEGECGWGGGRVGECAGGRVRRGSVGGEGEGNTHEGKRKEGSSP